MFNLPKFLLYLKSQEEAYLTHIFTSLEKNNPGWIDRLKKDRDLFDETGAPLTPSKELADKKVKSILENDGFIAPDITKEIIYKHFLIDKETLDKFIIEND